jgi:hypothetical protein
MIDTNDRQPWHRADVGEPIHEKLHGHGLDCINRNGRRNTLRGYEAVSCVGHRVSDGVAGTELEVISNAVLSVYASLCRAQPNTWVLTDNGSIDLQDRAELLTSWLAGVRVKLKTNAKMRRVLFETIVFGAGAIHTWAGKTGLKQDLVWVGNLGVEEREEEERCVGTIYRVRLMDRAAAQKLWPTHATDLAMAKNGLASADNPADDHTDMVSLLESYHVSDPECDVKGRHAIVASSCTLKHVEWDHEMLPYDVLNFDPVPSRYFGRGLVESMLSGQAVVEQLGDKIVVSYKKGGGHWFVPQDSGVAEEQITDAPHTVIPIAPGANAPVFVAVPPISADYREEQQTAIDRLYQLRGVSQLAASSLVPPGVESGKAMRVYNDTEQAYWYPKSSEYEDFCVAVDRSSIRAAEEIMARGEGAEKTLKVLGMSTAGGRTTLRRMGYGEARFDEESMVLQTFPVAKLSTSPSGRIEDVKELVELEVPESRGDLLQLLGFPDTKRYQSLELAARHLVEMQVLSCLRGTYPEVDGAAIDLQYARKHSAQVLARAQLEGTDGNLALVRDYQNAIQSEIDDLEAKEMAKAAALQAPPPAAPAPLPPGAGPSPIEGAPPSAIMAAPLPA